MPPLPPSSPKNAIDRSGHDIRPRDVVVDLPQTIALLPGEADQIASILGELLVALFEEEEGNSKRQKTAGTPTAG
jgi:hypothetical protein